MRRQDRSLELTVRALSISRDIPIAICNIHRIEHKKLPERDHVLKQLRPQLATPQVQNSQHRTPPQTESTRDDPCTRAALPLRTAPRYNKRHRVFNQL